MSQQTKTSSSQLHISVGIVELNVKNLNVMKHFYQDLVGLQVLSDSSSSVVLGYGKVPVLHLTETPDLNYPPADDAGLYHTAILYESRYALAEALKRIISTAPFLYSGSADHLVSNAFYFSDPEGNGVELYFDTDPGTWEWKDGKIVMGSKHLDINEFIHENNVRKGSEIIKPGHVHLKVGDIEEARKFYVDVLGMHLTALMPSALFISDGMYHHHIGMNVWESAGAGKRGETLGLRSFEIKIPDLKEMTALKERLKEANIGFKEHPDGISLQDPWDTTIIVTLD